jgi:hypothetical protein
MNRAQAFKILWAGTLVALVLWTVLSYMNTTSPELRQEILFRHSFVIILLSLPLGGVAALLAAAAVYALGFSPTAMQDAWLTSIVCVVASYIQWFQLVPWLRNRWRRRA